MTPGEALSTLGGQELTGFNLTMAREDLRCAVQGVLHPNDNDYCKMVGAYLEAFEQHCAGKDELNGRDRIVQCVTSQLRMLTNDDHDGADVYDHIDFYTGLQQSEGLPVDTIAAAKMTLADHINRRRPIIIQTT